MDPKKIDPKIVEAEVMRGGAHIFGRRELQITVSHLCVNCFPTPEPAIFTWAGMSLCQKCFVPLRKAIDNPWGWPNGGNPPVGISKRTTAYKETWGEEPPKDAEVI